MCSPPQGSGYDPVYPRRLTARSFAPATGHTLPEPANGSLLFSIQRKQRNLCQGIGLRHAGSEFVPKIWLGDSHLE